MCKILKILHYCVCKIMYKPMSERHSTFTYIIIIIISIKNVIFFLFQQINMERAFMTGLISGVHRSAGVD